MRTYIRWYDAEGELEDSIILRDDDATTQAIAEAVIELISSRMSMHPGDRIEIIES
jgi:hypothetical protein